MGASWQSCLAPPFGWDCLTGVLLWHLWLRYKAVPMRLRQHLAPTGLPFAFAATGEPAARTMPDRLADVKNVKDFGAVGDGSNNDTTAIQAAVNWTSAANRGTIFFPTGSYKITAPITFNFIGALNICFRGEGEASVLIMNRLSGFME